MCSVFFAAHLLRAARRGQRALARPPWWPDFDPVRRIVRLISDNPAYEPVDNINPSDLRIFGRAIWLGRKL